MAKNELNGYWKAFDHLVGYRPGVMDKATIRHYLEYQRSQRLSIPAEIHSLVSEVLRLYYGINRESDDIMRKVGVNHYFGFK